jgi:hypothetical protein
MKTQMHETQCALVRLPLASHGKRRHRPGFGGTSRRPRTRSTTYESTPRITYIDRAIVRAYYEQQAAIPRVCRWDDSAGCIYGPVHSNQILPQAAAAAPLPAELERKLSVLAPRFERLIVGDDIVLVETQSRVIYDVVQNFRHTF